jgi:hypothetical protein
MCMHAHVPTYLPIHPFVCMPIPIFSVYLCVCQVYEGTHSYMYAPSILIIFSVHTRTHTNHRLGRTCSAPSRRVVQTPKECVECART